MAIEIDLSEAKCKAHLLLDDDHLTEFNKWFDSEGYLDIIENANDYLAEGIITHFYEQIDGE